VAIRGGFLTTSQSSEDVNEYGIVAFSALAGLFAKQALDRLERVFNVIFGSKDDLRADSLAHPSPVITDVKPEEFRKQHAEVLVIRGAGFTVRSKVRVAVPGEGEGRILAGKLTFLSPEELRLTVHEQAIPEPGLLYVTVANPEPGGGMSGPYPVVITDDGDGVDADVQPATGDSANGLDVSPTVEPSSQVIERTVEDVAAPSETVEETAEHADLQPPEPAKPAEEE
jgi:hypothetical protein